MEFFNWLCAALGASAGPVTGPTARPFSVNDSQLVPCYINAVRLIENQRELIVEWRLVAEDQLGLSEQPLLATRLVMSYYTAKRLVMALEMALQLHEKTFGLVEPDGSGPDREWRLAPAPPKGLPKKEKGSGVKLKTNQDGQDASEDRPRE